MDERQPGLLVADRPLVPLLYRLLRDNDLSIGALEGALEDLERMPPFIRQQFELPDIANYARVAADRLERVGHPTIRVANGVEPEAPMKGLILIVVVDEPTNEEKDAVARVCRDFDVTSAEALATELSIAVEQAKRQIRINARVIAGSRSHGASSAS
jgi:hypothetical protein